MERFGADAALLYACRGLRFLSGCEDARDTNVLPNNQKKSLRVINWAWKHWRCTPIVTGWWVHIQVSLNQQGWQETPTTGKGNVFMSCLYLSGRGGALLRTYRPVCPPKPANLFQRTKVPDERCVSLSSLTLASSASSLSSSASSTSGSFSTCPRRPQQRRRAAIPDTVKLPPGVLLQSASSPQTPSGNWALSYFRKKDQPGRRKDSTQSLYIDSPECDMLMHFSSCPPSSSSSSISIVAPEDQNHNPQASKGQRHFSDLDLAYMDKDVWQERCFCWCSSVGTRLLKITIITGHNFPSTFLYHFNDCFVVPLYDQCFFSPLFVHVNANSRKHCRFQSHFSV